MDDFSFTDNPAAHRFELRHGGALAAHADYTLGGGTITFVHTEVLKEYEGQGLGSRIAKSAFEEVRRRGLEAIPVCSFMAGYLRKHPQEQDILGERGRSAMER
ncbi:GNAT family N-acetyltransferase [Caenimonas aquaedulcis]|uniref:N-acetyltransferase n=1 Tax=Caenimonas aquaedulcis TaxID=2793270 RepID=A0A931MIC6_9BURK|nr:GNAT family N-acetyltransferase [Caenimonas aquaedulcis]MBG9389852.1 N-acetyltransferase [Caenimonas aquaedulcis]